jgi:hypothetical protein
MRKILPRLTYANVMSTIAVFAALGGGAYAAVKLPKNSVGAAQIKANAVSASKVRDGSLTAKDFAKAQLPAGAAGETGPAGATGPQGQKGDAGAAGSDGTDGADGAAGAPGTARAYGLVGATGTLSATKRKNVVAVTNPVTGVFCIELDPSIDMATTDVVVSPDFATDDTSSPSGNGNDQAIVEMRSNRANCGSNKLEIRTMVQSFTAGALVTNPDANEPVFCVVP